ncbi:MAG: Asp-tRNA(Asn)/Glu-tRNA(Gln) amidotransferase subunit GatA [Candidatus Firestonebacteria bacterium]
MKLNELTAYELKQKLSKGEITSSEIVTSVFEQINKTEEKLHAYIRYSFESAIEQAKICDKKLRAKENHMPLLGIPIAIKDNICMEGEKATCGSKILENFVAPYDATVISKLKKAGAIFIGRTNMDEFAMGSSTENSYFGPTKNPWDVTRVPGGSSGGSAVAVASCESILSLGSETGGSVRQPASCCGVVGFKPTYGRVSRYGLVAFASSLDQIGSFARDVRDCALLMEMISGHDEFDSTTANVPVPKYTELLDRDIKGLKFGIPKEYFIEGVDAEVKEAILIAIKQLEILGAIPVEISLPHTQYCLPVYYIIAPCEASSNLARFDGVHYGYRSPNSPNLLEMYKNTRAEGFGKEVKRRIMIGTYALSSGYYDAYYVKALKVRTLIKRDFEEVFKKCDCIITPTSPTSAFKIGERVEDPVKMYLADIFTVSVNLAGVPAISVPCGWTKEKLPIGLQIIGKHYDEETIFRVAYAYEQSTNWHKQRPNI